MKSPWLTELEKKRIKIKIKIKIKNGQNTCSSPN